MPLPCWPATGSGWRDDLLAAVTVTKSLDASHASSSQQTCNPYIRPYMMRACLWPNTLSPLGYSWISALFTTTPACQRMVLPDRLGH
jgi:hypothetical protein